MWLLDYLRGRRVAMVTPLPAREVERRINAGTVSMIRPGSAGVSGWARLGRLRLWIRERGWNVSAAIVLAGRIQGELIGSRLHLRLRPSLWVYYSLGAWYVTACSTYGAFLASVGWRLDDIDIAAAATLIFVATLILPLRFTRSDEASANLDLAEMIEFLELEAQAKIVG